MLFNDSTLNSLCNVLDIGL